MPLAPNCQSALLGLVVFVHQRMRRSGWGRRARLDIDGLAEVPCGDKQCKVILSAITISLLMIMTNQSVYKANFKTTKIAPELHQSPPRGNIRMPLSAVWRELLNPSDALLMCWGMMNWMWQCICNWTNCISSLVSSELFSSMKTVCSWDLRWQPWCVCGKRGGGGGANLCFQAGSLSSSPWQFCKQSAPRQRPARLCQQ